jgi:hypothetical protein
MLCGIRRDVIHDLAFDAWEPLHPLLTAAGGQSGPDLNQGTLSWDIFVWALAQAARRVPVVGESQHQSLAAPGATNLLCRSAGRGLPRR